MANIIDVSSDEESFFYEDLESDRKRVFSFGLDRLVMQQINLCQRHQQVEAPLLDRDKFPALAHKTHLISSTFSII